MTFHYGLSIASRSGTGARRADQLGALAIHWLAFITVNAGLFTQTGFRPGAGHFWGWGIGVAVHTLAAAGPGSRLEQPPVPCELDPDGG